MKNLNHHHRSSNQFPNKVSNQTPHQKSGSIMIWTVMLGLVLTSVFFFFSMRQRTMLSVQRDTATMQNAKLFTESYADYLEIYPKNPPPAVDGITAKLSQAVDSIENAIDFGDGKQQTYKFSGSIYVEWNRCSDSLKGDLMINDVLYKASDPAACAPGKEYSDTTVSTISVTSPFTIGTQNNPFYFRIKPVEGTDLIDNQWHLEVTKDLDYGKKVTIKRTFPVTP